MKNIFAYVQIFCLTFLLLQYTSQTIYSFMYKFFMLPVILELQFFEETGQLFEVLNNFKVRGLYIAFWPMYQLFH